MDVITRFAPSPTGFLHIGGARTALFNYLFAKHHGGKFLLRIEDTDKERSSKEAVDAILDSMQWLELNWDDEVVYQSSRQKRHQEVVAQLLESGMAYNCYCSVEELAEMRKEAEAKGERFRYDRRWRDRPESDKPQGIEPCVRIKAPLDSPIQIDDMVQGSVATPADELDDLIIMRADGTPTYMLAVVVDDHDMGVTHIIRGDDHLTNSAKQKVIYDALSWGAPRFAHIPLIHGADGAKLSKRHGAIGAEKYRDMGYLPEALNNYLLRLGFSHGNDEIISRDQAIEWFDGSGLGKGAARFDALKLDNLNAHYIKNSSDEYLAELAKPLIEKNLAINIDNDLLAKAMSGLKQRAKNINELAADAHFYFISEIIPDEKAKEVIANGGGDIINKVIPLLSNFESWNHEALFASFKELAEKEGLKLGKMMGPIRAAITGKTTSPSMFEVMEILGREETIRRLQSGIKLAEAA